MKKRTIAALAAIVVFAACFILLFFGVAYHARYHIEADNSNLAEALNGFLNRGNNPPIQYDIKIHESLDFGSERFTSFEVNGKLGMIELLRGINGKHKIEVVRHGTGNFRDQVVESNGQKYYLLFGRNADFGIKKLTLILDNKEYSADVPEGSLFFVSMEIDSNTATYPGLSAVRFYDAAGADITGQVPWH